MRTEIDYQILCAEIEHEFPDFKIINKKNSMLMKAINVGLKVITLGKMNAFMTSFTTTLGNKVYVPDGWFNRTVESRMIVMRHERIHMRQSKNDPLFSLKYALFPLPAVFSHFRKKFEQEAYEESMLASLEYYGSGILLNESYRRSMIEHFTSAEYFWTWPWRKSIEKWYDDAVTRLLNALS